VSSLPDVRPLGSTIDCPLHVLAVASPVDRGLLRASNTLGAAPLAYSVASNASRMRAKSTESAKVSDMPRKPLTLIAQLLELPHLGLVHRRPATEEDGHALVAIALRLFKLLRVERQQVPWQVLDHAPVPFGLPTGFLSSPNHIRTFAAKLRMTCISTSLCRSRRNGQDGQSGKRARERHPSGPSPKATSSKSSVIECGLIADASCRRVPRDTVSLDGA
jgi:hypothetical protein